jgi:antitoxin HicB
VTPFPYRVVVRWSEPDGAYVAEVPALPGAGGDGPTMEEATLRAQESARELLDVMVEHKDPIPNSDLEEPEFSGQIRLRMPKSMHRSLAVAAEGDGVSLNQYMVTLLSAQMQRQPVERFAVHALLATPVAGSFTGAERTSFCVSNIARFIGPLESAALTPVTYNVTGAWKITAPTAVTEPMVLKA